MTRGKRRIGSQRLAAHLVILALAGCGGVGGAGLGLAQASASEGKPFGIQKFEMRPVERTEEVDLGGGRFKFVNEPYAFTQAGGHPWALTTVGELDNEEISANGGTEKAIVPTHDPKDVVANLPPGLLGDPEAVPLCPLAEVTSPEGAPCPPDTQIGWYLLSRYGGKQELGPIVDVTPEPGQSAEFALENHVKGAITPLLTAHLVRNEKGEYAFNVTSGQIPLVALYRFELTFWGVPSDKSHDAMRGLFCASTTSSLSCQAGGEPSGMAPVPFITMPSNCAAGPETATLRADSWQEPGSVREGRYTGYVEKSIAIPGATGCDLLSFNSGAGIEVQPDNLLADEPVGLGVGLRLPLNEGAETNAAPLLRATQLTLPEGLSISPGIVDGIKACDEFGPEGINISGPESEEVAANGELQLAPGHCPAASTVGTAEAVTPFLPVPVKGHVYLARPGCGGARQAPCTERDALDGNLYKLYLEIGGKGVLAGEGIVFKVPLEVSANPATGQLTTTARELVQAPYSEVTIQLNGGPRAPLDSPAVCGQARSTVDFTPWSAPGITPEGLAVAGTPDLQSSSYFVVGGCANPQPLAPGFVAGTTKPRAAKFSSFTMNLTRQDREQYLKGIEVHTPPGMLGVLSNVPLCGEPAADEGACPEASKIGTTRVASGAGSHPFEIEGNVYLTGPYRGAPFGLSVVTHAAAGPFDLGLVVVRARIVVSRTDSTLRITTDETGPHAIPQIIFGVPLRLQRISVDVDRPAFMFNPTNCSALAVRARVSGSSNAVAETASPFAVAGCKSLSFKPTFTVSTNGHTSRAKGASLDAKLAFPRDSFGNDANVARVKVSLPKQLPSRLSTLQHACPAVTFEQNPAACSTGSVVGIARAYTPLLPRLAAKQCRRNARCPKEPPMSVEGPVYFVSHGGESFPQLIVVLQGDGVRVDLVGNTFISKAGITSSTFKTIPDVPVSTFELYLPQGPGSALAANGDLCKARNRLRMPTEFVAQNGAVLKRSTRIAVSGCGKRGRSR
jgi:hypothetical protein